MYSNRDNIEFLTDPTLVESELIYDGSILQLYLNQVRLEGGELAYRELINHQKAVAVLAISDQDTVFLVKQYRAAVADYFIEIPAGLRDYIDGEEEDALMAAQRELEEETSLQADFWQKLGSYYVSPGFLNEKITIYKATGLKIVDNPLSQDDDEYIELLELNRNKVKELMAQGEIKDMKTQLALNYWLNSKDETDV
ncbi:NUDIX hydrolase [Aerococcaceae bacterium WGS1372]